jgi:ribosomal peptide maturation radical SAM protein 1
MTRIALVNMPFADWHRPSFALSQLAALARREYPDDAKVDVYYPNQDFAERLGGSTYAEMASTVDHLTTGIGDWLFRQLAFPELPDNSAQYFRRYYLGPGWQEFRQKVSALRAGLKAHCFELIDRYDLASADVVGFTSMFAQTVPSIALARIIKQRNPDVITIFGGANCETPMGDVLIRGVPDIDFVFSGPALHSFADFIGCVTRKDLNTVHAIPGILSRRSLAVAGVRPTVGRERDIDDLVEPDYQSFMDSLRNRPRLVAAQNGETQPILYFETSRGCWWGERSHCTFCGLNGLDMSYRIMSPPVALRQFRRLFSFAPWCTQYHCTDNIMPKTYPRYVFPELEPPAGTTIFYEVKVPLSEREMRSMSDAGVNKVQPGIEALSTATLKLMGKGTTAFQNIHFLKNCIRFAVEPLWNLLIGFPGEREDVYEKYAKDIPLLVHLPPPSGAYMVRFDRFSPYFTRSSEYNLDLSPMDFYSLIYPFSDKDLQELAYFFQNMKISPYLEAAVAWIGRLNRQVAEWRHCWEHEADRPRLLLDQEPDGSWAIIDSRFGLEQRVKIDEETRVLLRRLASPARLDELGEELGLEHDAVASRLRLLDDHRVLFEEDGSLISLLTGEDGTAGLRGSGPAQRARSDPDRRNSG